MAARLALDAGSRGSSPWAAVSRLPASAGGAKRPPQEAVSASETAIALLLWPRMDVYQRGASCR